MIYTESNFMQLLKLSARDDSALAEWLKKKTNKYVWHSFQNELLQLIYGIDSAAGVIAFHPRVYTFYSIM